MCFSMKLNVKKFRNVFEWNWLQKIFEIFFTVNFIEKHFQIFLHSISLKKTFRNFFCSWFHWKIFQNFFTVNFIIKHFEFFSENSKGKKNLRKKKKKGWQEGKRTILTGKSDLIFCWVLTSWIKCQNPMKGGVGFYWKKRDIMPPPPCDRFFF